VAGVLNQMDKEASASLLHALESASPDLAASVKNLMFVFDDLQQVDDAALREIVQRAERKDLLVALKGAPPALRARFLANMSKRAGEMFQEELDMLGPLRLRDVEKAQREIVAVVRTLEEEGLVTIGASAGDEYVV
jgi:flagellar motor switch protein FliG